MIFFSQWILLHSFMWVILVHYSKCSKQFSICLKLLTRKLLFVLLSNCLFLLISIIIISTHCKVMYTHINQFHIIAGMELLVCAVHPIPGRFYFLWTTKLSNHGGKIGSQWVPVDVTLSLPMFLRYTIELKHSYI